MGTSDGSVLGLVKVHDGGNPADRLNIVITSDGYISTRMAQFAQDVDDFVDHFFSTPPFNEEAIACAFNIYRLDVVSDEAGADKPECDGNGATPVLKDTYFDSTFCFGGETQRLLYGDAGAVQTAVEAALPEWGQIIVFVDDPERGGGGGSVAWTSNSSSDWLDVTIHELGHSLFGLADEYNYGGPDDYAGSAMAPNIDTEPDPALVKWNPLVTSNADVPTLAHPDCSDNTLAPNISPSDIVGIFESAAYSRCGVYRPQYSCKMRRSTTPEFCAVCDAEIRDIMSDYTAPSVSGDITLDTPSVTFDDIPEGTSTVRPIVLNVDTCLPVTFEVISGPAAPFSVDGSPYVVSDTSGGTVRLARIWIRYDCAGAGVSDNSMITLRVAESGEEFNVNLSGNCVPRETAAVQMVFDRSASMLQVTSEGRTKADVLKDAARVLADVAYEDTGLGANTYDQDAQPLLATVVAGALDGGAGRNDLRNAITSYAPNPAGLTATGDGIEFARTQLDGLGSSYTNKAMIVLTDGKDTASKTVNEVADGVIDQTVFAIGMGTAEQIDPITLEALAGATGGYTLMTGLLTEDDTFKLEKFYLQILAGISNNDIILDPEGRLSPAAPTARIAFDVAETDIEITAVTLATFTDLVNMALEAPNGEVFQAAQAISNPSLEVSRSQDSLVMRSSLPLVGDSGTPLREGRWHLLLELDEKAFVKFLRSITSQIGSLDNTQALGQVIELIEDLRNHGVAYSSIVQTYSNLNMRVTLDQSGHEPGAEMIAEAIITEYGGPLRGSATVSADVTLPNGLVQKRMLTHQGDGVFTGKMTASASGLYSWRFRASGLTRRERPFTREQLRSASVWAGGDQPRDPIVPGGGNSGGGSGQGKDDGLIDLLCCIASKDGLDDRFYKWLESIGINADVFKRCLEQICEAQKKSGSTKIQAQIPTDLTLTNVQLDELRNRFDTMLRLKP